MEVDEDSDISIANMMKRNIEIVTKSQDNDSQENAKKVVDMNEENETDEENHINMMKIIVGPVADKVKDKKNEKEVPLKLPMKDTVTKKDKNPKENLCQREERYKERMLRKSL